MALFALLCAFVLGFYNVEATLSLVDSSFCVGGLEVVYPELDIDHCLKIPKKFREKISTVWEAPRVHSAGAHKDKMYTLVMVDLDAPSHIRPTGAPWRHWLVVDIQGEGLQRGEVDGRTLTSYYRPTPPHGSGFHRYQFLLFEQRPDGPVSLSELDVPRGKWDIDGFVSSQELGAPVATLQFRTQNHED